MMKTFISRRLRRSVVAHLWCIVLPLSTVADPELNGTPDELARYLSTSMKYRIPDS